MLDVDVKKIKTFQMDLLGWFENKHPELVNEITEKKALSDELTEDILKAAKEFKEAVWTNAREIQNRIKSIQDTRKITNAMYLISSTKLKKSRKLLEDTEPYFYTLQSLNPAYPAPYGRYRTSLL